MSFYYELIQVNNKPTDSNTNKHVKSLFYLTILSILISDTQLPIIYIMTGALVCNNLFDAISMCPIFRCLYVYKLHTVFKDVVYKQIIFLRKCPDFF